MSQRQIAALDRISAHEGARLPQSWSHVIPCWWTSTCVAGALGKSSATSWTRCAAR